MLTKTRVAAPAGLALAAAMPQAIARQNADFEHVVGTFVAGDMFVTQGVDVTVGPLVTSGFTISNVVGYSARTATSRDSSARRATKRA